MSRRAAAAASLAQANELTPVVVARGFANPWALAFLPDGQFLVTERPGRMRVVSAAGQAAMDALQNKTGAADGAGGVARAAAPAFAGAATSAGTASGRCCGALRWGWPSTWP